MRKVSSQKTLQATTGLKGSNFGLWVIGGGLLVTGAVLGGVFHSLAAVPAVVRTVLISVLLAPLIEELFFRGVVHEYLLHRRTPRLMAITVVAGLFAAAHLFKSGAGHAAATALPAVMIGLAYDRLRRQGLLTALMAAASLHGIFNAMWIGGLAELTKGIWPWAM